MNATLYSIMLVAITALCTLATRALPFAVFGGGRQLPQALRRLTGILPAAIMAVLVVYCLKGLTPADTVTLISTVAALAAVVGLQLWRRNTLLSIAAGTVIYMLLIRIL